MTYFIDFVHLTSKKWLFTLTFSIYTIVTLRIFLLFIGYLVFFIFKFFMYFIVIGLFLNDLQGS